MSKSLLCKTNRKLGVLVENLYYFRFNTVMLPFLRFFFLSLFCIKASIKDSKVDALKKVSDF